MTRDVREATISLLETLVRLPPVERVRRALHMVGLSPSLVSVLSDLSRSADNTRALLRFGHGALVVPFLGAGCKRRLQREQERLVRPPRGWAVPGLRPPAVAVVPARGAAAAPPATQGAAS